MLLTIAFLGLLGCPLPPDNDQTSSNTNAPQQGNAQPKNQMGGKQQGAPANLGGGNGGAGNAGGGKAQTQGAAGGVLMDMGQLKAQKSQEEIDSQEHVTISGTIQGECTGLLRLDVIGTEDLGGPKDGGEMKGPITTKELTGTGEFSVMVPKSSSVNLSVLCDADRNQKITADADQLSLGARLGVVDEDVSDVTLVLEEIKPPSGELPPPKE